MVTGVVNVGNSAASSVMIAWTYVLVIIPLRCLVGNLLGIGRDAAGGAPL